MSHETKSNNGFTAVELVIALAFISSLLLLIAATVIQISNMYSRGITVKAVNQAGSTIATDIKRSIESSMSVSVDATSKVYINDEFGLGGRLCLDAYTYIWNYGKSLNNGSATNKYSSGTNQIRLAKVRDPGASYCLNPTSSINPLDAIDLLASGDRTLALQSFKIESNDYSYDKLTNSRLYTVTFHVGTNKRDSLNDDYKSCKPPGQIGSDLSYCMVEEFKFAVMSGNKYQE